MMGRAGCRTASRARSPNRAARGGMAFARRRGPSPGAAAPKSEEERRTQVMSKRASKKAPVDRATATIKADTKSDALKTSVTNTIAQAMQKSTNWGAATD